MTDYYVYWYKLTGYSNPHCQGYIGITNDIDRRHKEHCRNAKVKKHTHFYNAINKYGLENVQKVVLHECTMEEALEFELYYRPDTNIGWNSAIGGEDTLASVQSKEVTLYHKDNPDKLYTFNSMTEAGKELGISAGRIRQAVHRDNPNYGFDGWAVLIDETINRYETISIQESISKRLAGNKHSKPSHFKGVTDRWSDEDKERISKQHKGKVISEEQKAIVRDKNRADHSSCKSITLAHTDNPNVEFTYHSISEASRKLGIPLSRLKSRVLRNNGNYGKDGWKIVKLGSE